MSTLFPFNTPGTSKETIRNQKEMKVIKLRKEYVKMPLYLCEQI
jgi:hypothetical protein